MSKQLRRVPAVGPQSAVVGFHQVALSDGGDGLQLGEIAGPLGELELAEPRADGARSDQRHVAAGGHQFVQFLGQRGDALAVEQAAGAGEHARADFDHDGVGRGGDFLTHEIGHSRRNDIRKTTV